LLREAELSIAKRAAAVDRMAAVLILQSYLDAHARNTAEQTDGSDEL
jgi:RNase H-fold protein (predicted Holliday junction resolvase)